MFNASPWWHIEFGRKKYSLLKIAFIILLALYFYNTSIHPSEWHFIDSINLIFHEAGHSIFGFFSEFIYIISGSIVQILIPLICVIYFFYKRNFFSMSIIMLWLGQSMTNLSVYIGDAIRMDLPLLGGDNSIHDWNYILNSLGILQFTPTISQIVYSAGVIIITVAICIAFNFVRVEETGFD